MDVQTSGVYDVDFHKAVAELPNKKSITIDNDAPIEQVDSIGKQSCQGDIFSCHDDRL